MVFRDLSFSCPDVIPREVHVLPAERRQMGEELIWNLAGLAHGGDGALKVASVPEDDRGDEKVQTRGAMLLVLVGAITDFAKPMMPAMRISGSRRPRRYAVG